MDQDQKTVIGVFDDYGTAQQAARELESEGVSREAINIQSNVKTGAAGYGGAEMETPADENHEGGIKGFFHRLFGGDDDERGNYQEALRRGNAVVAVTAPANQLDRIARVMTDLGAVDIDRRANYYRETGYSGYDESSPAYTSDEALRDRENFRNHTGQTAVPVIEEKLQVGKRAVQRGGVRVYSHVVDEPVQEQIQLREEHVRVERRPANRSVEQGDLARLKDQTIEVTETAEEPVVSKRAVVREEVLLGKETTERTETIQDNLRRTEVQVDAIAGSTTAAGSNVAAEPGSGPAYAYGSRMAAEPRYSGRSWKEVENDIRVDYMRNNPTSRWDEVKAEIRRGWDKVTGQR
ncbi:MAG TPA: YsnF/AvaK domain-containing protein [Bryobacteraceae bacterium]|nr:YsnF/AvaK domain-containing protein [Bryobacteraceae bacterium]